MMWCRLFALIAFLLTTSLSAADGPAPLPGTKRLTMTGDIASQMVEGVDRFLLAETEKSIERRGQHWNRDTSSVQKYNASIEPNRKRLAHILGVRDERVPFDAPELLATTSQPALIGQGEAYSVFAVRWPAFGDVHGEGLLLVPAGARPVLADVIAIPDAAQTPEMIAGLTEGIAPQSQFARRLAESGCRVLVPTLIDRNVTHRRLTNREFLYRSAFEMGRHPIGYELQKVLAGVDWFAKEAGDGDAKIGVIGYGEGGMLALYAAALDTRIDAACVSGYFGSRQKMWQEPIDRNVFGRLEQFGDAELAAMIAPRALIVEVAAGPQFEVPPGTGGGPGKLVTPTPEEVRDELVRAGAMLKGLHAESQLKMVVSGDGTASMGSATALLRLLERFGDRATLAEPGKPPKHFRKDFDPAPRHRQQMHELDRHTQWLLRESPHVRREFFERLDTSSSEKFNETIEWYRDTFYDEIIGRFDDKPLPPNVRTRQAYDEPKWTGYEVVMDVFPDVIAYGILLLPKDIKPNERRPVVVCQHGLEGRPQDVVSGDGRSYHDFAAKLAERGFVTFAPQNLYIFGDRFRTLQRKANPLGKTLFSIII
ncbi:MAG: dienelactone hydrolase family protein, partial [Candidatus Nealsonbacteria bacterium]|nr:dienelactone hydrolase family protein [Candidatus Nealsonbacteria bacterium]